MRSPSEPRPNSCHPNGSLSDAPRLARSSGSVRQRSHSGCGIHLETGSPAPCWSPVDACSAIFRSLSGPSCGGARNRRSSSAASSAVLRRSRPQHRLSSGSDESPHPESHSGSSADPLGHHSSCDCHSELQQVTSTPRRQVDPWSETSPLCRQDYFWSEIVQPGRHLVAQLSRRSRVDQSSPQAKTARADARKRHQKSTLHYSNHVSLPRLGKRSGTQPFRQPPVTQE